MSRRGSRTGDRFLVVGRRPVLEALSAGRVRAVLLPETAGGRGRIGEILEAAERGGVTVRRLPREKIDAVGAEAADQGVAAEVSLPPPLSEGDLAGREWDERAVAVVLDGVMDPRNVGAVARTAEAVGAAALVLRRRRASGVTPVAVKTSAGALVHLPVAEVANIPRALGRLRESGFWVVGLAGDAATALGASPRPPGRLALVLGSEERGLSRLARRACDELVAIPVRGRVGSLNVSAAAAVALFAYRGEG